MSEVLDSNFNGYPKVTDWDKVYFLLQQANSEGFNAATKKEIVQELFGDVVIQGADYEDLPVAESPDPVPLPIPEANKKFGFLANGKYSQPNGPTLEYSASQWGLTSFDGEKWVKKFTLDLPQIDTSNLATKTEVFNGVGKNKFNPAKSIVGKIIRRATGAVEDDPTAAISGLIPISSLKRYVLSGRNTPALTVRFVDAQGTSLRPKKSDGSDFEDYWYTGGQLIPPATAENFQFAWRANNVGDTSVVQFEEGTTATAFEPYTEKIAPSNIAELPDYTQKGGSNKTAQQLDQDIAGVSTVASAAVSTANSAVTKANEANTLSAQAGTISNNALAKANEALGASQNVLGQAKVYTDTKIFNTGQLQDAAITPAKLSQSTLDLINTAGGGSIVNNPDEEDITKLPDDRLRFKDGADGFARVRLATTPANQITEIINKANAYKFVLIKDILDFGGTDSARVTLTIPDGTTLRFEGKGMLKNVRLAGKFSIESGRKRIFENVQMFYLGSPSGTVQPRTTLDDLIITAAYPVDLYDMVNNIIISTGSQLYVDFNVIKPFTTKASAFGTPVQESGKWYFKNSSGSNLIRFENDVNGKVYLFKSKRYIFVDSATGSVLSQDTWVDPSTIKIGIVGNWFYNTAFSYCRIECDQFYPEWWGVVPSQVVDNKRFFNHCFTAVSMMGGGAISFQSGLTYWSQGGIFARNYLRLIGNLATIKLMAGSGQHLLVQDIASNLYSFDGENIAFDGNKAEQTVPLNALFFDDPRGENVDIQVKYTALTGYSWDASEWHKANFNNASQDGFFASIPGDVSLFNCRAESNARDGWVWHKEHLKMYECLGWTNGRDGLRTEGLHFRVIGGAYAHNGRYNMNIQNAAEFQIIAPSAIDCPNHGMYLKNCKTFTITAARILTAGGAGMMIESDCSEGYIQGCMVFNNTAGDIVNNSGSVYTINNRGAQTTISQSIPIVQAAANTYDLNTGKAFYTLLGGRKTGEFKYLVGSGAANLPAGITYPFLVDIANVAIGTANQNRMFITLKGFGDAGTVLTREFLYDSGTQTDLAGSGTSWKKLNN